MPGPHDRAALIESLAMREVTSESGELDLDAELGRLVELAQAQAPAEPAQSEEISPEDGLRAQILEMLKKHPSAPSEETIADWKKKYGEDGVQVIALDPTNVYVYRFLTNSEWEKVQSATEQLAKQPNQDINKAMRQTVVKLAVLWPKLDSRWFETCRAGLPSTLYESILIASYFLNPQQSLTITTRI